MQCLFYYYSTYSNNFRPVESYARSTFLPLWHNFCLYTIKLRNITNMNACMYGWEVLLIMITKNKNKMNNIIIFRSQKVGTFQIYPQANIDADDNTSASWRDMFLSGLQDLQKTIGQCLSCGLTNFDTWTHDTSIYQSTDCWHKSGAMEYPNTSPIMNHRWHLLKWPKADNTHQHRADPSIFQACSSYT